MTPLPTPANCPDPTGSASGETPLEESSVNLRQLWTNSCPTIELTPGEYLDRLAIADVKVKKCSPANYRRAIEQSAQLFSLAHAVRCNTVAFEALTRHLSELMVVHTRLWDVENEIRELDKIVHQTYDGKLRDWDRVLWHRISDEASNALVRYLQLAREVYVLNDQRTTLKRKVDEAFGMSPEIKEYSTYAPSDNPSPTS